MSRTSRSRIATLVLLLATASSSALAQPPRNQVSVAAGLATSWHQRRDYGAASRGVFIPELVGFAYLRPPWWKAWPKRLFVRGGGRLAYAGLQQAEMPESVQIRERDLIVTGDVGVGWDGLVVPSLTLGASAWLRSIDLVTRDPAMAGTATLDRTRLHPAVSAQLGMGLPFADGLVLVEPFVRLEVIAGDDRGHLRYGVEVTYQLR